MVQDLASHNKAFKLCHKNTVMTKYLFSGASRDYPFSYKTKSLCMCRIVQNIQEIENVTSFFRNVTGSLKLGIGDIYYEIFYGDFEVQLVFRPQRKI